MTAGVRNRCLEKFPCALNQTDVMAATKSYSHFQMNSDDAGEAERTTEHTEITKRMDFLFFSCFSLFLCVL